MRRLLTILIICLAATALAPATGTAATATWSISPTSYEFAPQLPDTGATQPAIFSLSNSGETTVPTPFVVIRTGYNSDEGAPPARFLVTNNCGPIPPGGTCTLEVRFEALAPGPREASMTVEAEGFPTLTASLLATGIGPMIEFSPPGLFLASRLLGTELYPPNFVTVGNRGDADLDFYGISLQGLGVNPVNPNGFRIAGGTCAVGTPVPAKGSCTVQVTYTPIQEGFETAELQFLDNALQGEQRVKVIGTGSGDKRLGPATTAITASPPAVTRRTWARFRFAAEGFAVPFVCRLDAGDWRRCESPRTYRHLRPGRHVFRVKPALRTAGLLPARAIDRFRILPRPLAGQPSGSRHG